MLQINAVYGSLAQGISEKDISKWPREYFCDILTKNVAALCLSLKICLRLNFSLLD